MSLKLTRVEPAESIERQVFWDEHSRVYCPYCGIEQGENPENILNGDPFNEYNCDECDEEFTVEKMEIVIYSTHRND